MTFYESLNVMVGVVTFFISALVVWMIVDPGSKDEIEEEER